MPHAHLLFHSATLNQWIQFASPPLFFSLQCLMTLNHVVITTCISSALHTPQSLTTHSHTHSPSTLIDYQSANDLFYTQFVFLFLNACNSVFLLVLLRPLPLLFLDRLFGHFPLLSFCLLSDSYIWFESFPSPCFVLSFQFFLLSFLLLVCMHVPLLLANFFHSFVYSFNTIHFKQF